MNTLIRRLWNAPRNLVRRLRLVDEFQGITNEVRALSKDLKYEATTELSFTVNDFIRIANRLKADLSDLRSNMDSRLNQFQAQQLELKADLSSLANRFGQIENQQFETKNLAVHLTTSLSGLKDQLENERFESKNLIIHLTTSLEARLNKFENELLPAVNNEIHESIAIELAIRAQLNSAQNNKLDLAGERYAPAELVSHNYLARAEQEFPEAYGFWRERLDAMRSAFLKTKIGNAAHASDTYSHIFRNLVRLHAEGHVLDVGCGIFGVPYYLESYPTERISGIDPLKSSEPSAFEFVQGISEYLPWRDNAFSTVISATSLDHCLSLDRSLSEIRRVLQPNGRFLLWIGSNAGSAPYEPLRRGFAPVDEFHLFHFDVAWFEPMLAQWFNVIERIELRKTTFSHVFYCLTKKAEAGADGSP